MRLTMLLLLAVVLATAGTVLELSRHTYAAQSRLEISSPISREFPAGTDELGRDRAVRLAAALLLGLLGACTASLIASLFSLLLGALAAMGPRRAGQWLIFGSDLFLTLPWIFLLMLIRAALPLSLPPLRSGAVTFLLLALLGIPAFLRINYRRALNLMASDWVLQCRAHGIHTSLLARHLLPHFRPIFWTQCLLYIPVCIVAEANLGTLGLGIAEPLPSWGNMLAGLQSAALLNTSWLTYLPLAMLVLVLTSLELSLFGADREA